MRAQPARRNRGGGTRDAGWRAHRRDAGVLRVHPDRAAGDAGEVARAEGRDLILEYEAAHFSDAHEQGTRGSLAMTELNRKASLGLVELIVVLAALTFLS